MRIGRMRMVASIRALRVPMAVADAVLGMQEPGFVQDTEIGRGEHCVTATTRRAML